MVEHTRAHERLKPEPPPGERLPLARGTLFIPQRLAGRDTLPLVVHFHGPAWLAEVAVARKPFAAAIALQLGSGSSAYARPFADSAEFGQLLDEAEKQANVHFQPIVLSAWSAGYGAIRQILRSAEHYDRVDAVLLVDGLHAGYVHGRPGPTESELVADDLDVFVRLARDAAAARKQLAIVHSEIFPGTFASTTETADYLVRQLGLRRKAILRWGPRGTQQLSEVRQQGLIVAGFAGNSAPDHVDLLHALPELLDWFDWDKMAQR